MRLDQHDNKAAAQPDQKKKRLFMCLLIVPLVLFDQLTKVWAVQALEGGKRIVLLPGILELTYVQNRGAAFGILQNARIFFLLITVAALAVIGYCLVRIPDGKKYRPMRLCLYLIAAGAVGNLIDRLFLSYVRDFIYFSLIDFPVFNVADIFITCATFVLLLLSLFYYREEEDFTFLTGDKKKDRGDLHG